MKIRLELGIVSALCLFGLTFCNGGSGLPAFAETKVGALRRVSITEATGHSGAQPPRIELSPGYGVNISFIPTGEIVEKVWFDNPAIATLDVDGCLSGLGGSNGDIRSQGKEAQCQSPGATVLHLRWINPLDFPGLPKTNSTLLTVITHGKAGRRVYLFLVAAGGKNPQYHTVEVTPPTTTVEPRARERSVVESVTDWQTLNRGLTVALTERLIRRGQPLMLRIQNFLARVKAGEPIDEAAAASGISLNLVRRLEELGRHNIPNPVPESVPTSQLQNKNSSSEPFFKPKFT
jgi:hypothetical protein